MKWDHFPTIWEQAPRHVRKSYDCLDLYQHFIRENPDGPRHVRGLMESVWYLARRPYYRVYPCVIDMARDLKPDTPVSYSWLPELPVFGEQGHGRSQVFTVETPAGSGVPPFLVSITTDDETKGWDFHIFRQINGDEFVSERGTFNARPHTISELVETVDKQKGLEIIHRIIFLMYLFTDPAIDLIDRIVLKRDEGKPLSRTVLDRAERLQGLGFSIGKKLESMPRRSRPHWGIRWCKPEHPGELAQDWDGVAPSSRPGCVPKLRPIKGANEEFYRKVPTGFHSPT